MTTWVGGGGASASDRSLGAAVASSRPRTRALVSMGHTRGVVRTVSSASESSAANAPARAPRVGRRAVHAHVAQQGALGAQIGVQRQPWQFVRQVVGRDRERERAQQRRSARHERGPDGRGRPVGRIDGRDGAEVRERSVTKARTAGRARPCGRAAA